MPAKVFKLGPGTLTLGTEPLDISCQITDSLLTPNKDSEDAVTVLCGDVIPGAVTYAWQLTGTVLTDLSAGGMAEYCFTNRQSVVAFEYTPNTAAAASFAGQLVIDPLDIGGKSGQNMTAEFEFDLVGDPIPTWPTPGTSATFPARFTFPDTQTYPKAPEPADPPAKGRGKASAAAE